MQYITIQHKMCLIVSSLQCYSFIHSGYFYSPLFKSSTTKMRTRHSTDTVPEFHADEPQATVSEIHAQGTYVAARARVAPMTIRTKVVDSTKEPPRPTN